MVGSDIGLDVIARTAPSLATIDIGPAVINRTDSATHAISAGYASAGKTVQLRVASEGRIVVRRIKSQ
jgi:hypothetical protein